MPEIEEPRELLADEFHLDLSDIEFRFSVGDVVAVRRTGNGFGSAYLHEKFVILEQAIYADYEEPDDVEYNLERAHRPGDSGIHYRGYLVAHADNGCVYMNPARSSGYRDVVAEASFIPRS